VTPFRNKFALVLGACLTLLACRDQATTWSAEAPSPDGRWLGSARTEQWGGFGTAHRATTVFLKQGAQDPAEILEFSHEAPTIHVTMTWLTPTHFDVTYGPERRGDSVSVSFQAVKIADIEITLRQVRDTSLR